MRKVFYDLSAPKQTVSVTLNSDLYAKAKGIGINASKVAEEAVAGEYALRHSALLAEEIRQDLLAAEEYSDKHGSFSELMREHNERAD